MIRHENVVTPIISALDLRHLITDNRLDCCTRFDQKSSFRISCKCCFLFISSTSSSTDYMYTRSLSLPAFIFVKSSSSAWKPRRSQGQSRYCNWVYLKTEGKGERLFGPAVLGIYMHIEMRISLQERRVPNSYLCGNNSRMAKLSLESRVTIDHSSSYI
jgi:hypothetical protein